MADTFCDEESVILADGSSVTSVSPSPVAVSGVPAFCENKNLPEMDSDSQSSILAAAAEHICSSLDSRSDSPTPVVRTPLTEQVIVLPFTEGLVLDTSSRPWTLRGPISDLAAPISAFASFGFFGSGFRPVPGSLTIFEAEITPAWSPVSLHISGEDVSPPADFPQVALPSGSTSNEDPSVLAESKLSPGSPPAVTFGSIAGLTLASSQMDSVRSSIKATPQEPQRASSAGSVSAHVQGGSGLADAPPPV